MNYEKIKQLKEMDEKRLEKYKLMTPKNEYEACVRDTSIVHYTRMIQIYELALEGNEAEFNMRLRELKQSQFGNI